MKTLSEQLNYAHESLTSAIMNHEEVERWNIEIDYLKGCQQNRSRLANYLERSGIKNYILYETSDEPEKVGVAVLENDHYYQVEGFTSGLSWEIRGKRSPAQILAWMMGSVI